MAPKIRKRTWVSSILIGRFIKWFPDSSFARMTYWQSVPDPDRSFDCMDGHFLRFKVYQVRCAGGSLAGNTLLAQRRYFPLPLQKCD